MSSIIGIAVLVMVVAVLAKVIGRAEAEGDAELCIKTKDVEGLDALLRVRGHRMRKCVRDEVSAWLKAQRPV